MYIFIINPVAGNGKAEKIHQRLKEAYIYQQLSAICYHTEYKGHAEELTQHLLRIHEKQDIKGFVVIGGDGTLHEVINGLKHKQIPIAFIPGGTGNDFARGCGMEGNPKKTIKAILKNKRPADYWLGVYALQQRKRRLFVNCFGIGFDAMVAKRAQRLRLLKWFQMLYLDSFIYLFALVSELMRFEPKPIIVNIDGEQIRIEKCFLLTVNNHPFFGGGMKINPMAKNNKDTFSILVIDAISKWKVLALFMTVFIGKHLRFKEVHTFEGCDITITSEEPVPYQSDGETGTVQYAHITKKGLPIKVLGERKLVR